MPNDTDPALDEDILRLPEGADMPWEVLRDMEPSTSLEDLVDELASIHGVAEEEVQQLLRGAPTGRWAQGSVRIYSAYAVQHPERGDAYVETWVEGQEQPLSASYLERAESPRALVREALEFAVAEEENLAGTGDLPAADEYEITSDEDDG